MGRVVVELTLLAIAWVWCSLLARRRRTRDEKESTQVLLVSDASRAGKSTAQVTAMDTKLCITEREWSIIAMLAGIGTFVMILDSAIAVRSISHQSAWESFQAWGMLMAIALFRIYLSVIQYRMGVQNLLAKAGEDGLGPTDRPVRVIVALYRWWKGLMAGIYIAVGLLLAILP
jgi:hypothetical protein